MIHCGKDSKKKFIKPKEHAMIAKSAKVEDHGKAKKFITHLPEEMKTSIVYIYVQICTLYILPCNQRTLLSTPGIHFQQDQSTLWSLSASNTLKCNAMLSNAKEC